MTERAPIQISLPSVGEEELEALRGPIESGWLTQGREVTAFEQEFASAHEVGHALAVTSCTTGLHLILAALDIGPGDEVVVPAFTWVATANVVLHCGATPVFVDVDPFTFNLDPKELAATVTPKTKAVIAVHLFGLCCDMDALRNALPSDVLVIEDAACAAGARYKNVPAGGLGVAAAFSFHPRKSVTTGEGGMVTTNDPALAEKMEKLRNHGAEISEEQRHLGPKPYILPNFSLLGYNYRMTDLQGAIGRVQLGKLDGFVRERSKWASYYRESLHDVSWLRLPDEPVDGRHAWQAFVCFVEPTLAPAPRNDLMEQLQAWGISTRPGTHAVHMLEYYREKYRIEPQRYPASMACDEHSMAIPLHNRMNKEDFKYVVSRLRSF